MAIKLSVYYIEIWLQSVPGLVKSHLNMCSLTDEVCKGVSGHLHLNVCSDTRVTAEPVSTSMDID